MRWHRNCLELWGAEGVHGKSTSYIIHNWSIGSKGTFLLHILHVLARGMGLCVNKATMVNMLEHVFRRVPFSTLLLWTSYVLEFEGWLDSLQVGRTLEQQPSLEVSPLYLWSLHLHMFWVSKICSFWAFTKINLVDNNICILSLDIGNGYIVWQDHYSLDLFRTQIVIYMWRLLIWIWHIFF